MTKTLTAWTGIDVSKDTFDIAYVSTEKGVPLEKDVPFHRIPARQFPRTLTGAEDALTWLDEALGFPKPFEEHVWVVMEACGKYAEELRLWLSMNRGPSICMITPSLTAAYAKSRGLRNKTDRVDARLLALFGQERKPKIQKIPSRTYQILKDLWRCRQEYVELQVAEKNRAGQPLQTEAVQKIRKKHLEELQDHIDRVEKEIKKLLNRAPKLKKDVDLLCTIKGIGFLTAVMVIAEMGDLRRFARSRQVGAFAGLNPSKFESGTSVKKTTIISRKGSAVLRAGLYMPALTACRFNEQMKIFYERLIRKGKSKKAAVVAVMRKLLVLMRAILKTGVPYQEDFQKGASAEKMCKT